MASKVLPLLKFSQTTNQLVRYYGIRPFNCNTTVVTKKHRRIYSRTYPTILQYSDGSTINIPYHEPVGVIKLPLDLSTLTPEEVKLRLLKRVPKSKIKIVEDIEDDFDENRYIKKKK